MCHVSLRFWIASLCLLGIAGCGQQGAGSDRAVTITPVVEAPAAKVPPGDACDLLSDAEIQRVFPGAIGGRPDRSGESLGLARCDWGSTDDNNKVTVGWWWRKPTGDETARQQMAGRASMLGGVSDSKRLDVRFEPLPGMGDEAIMMIEPVDPARGVRSSFANLIIQHGNQWVSLTADPLTERNRADALAALTELGRAMAGRLDAQSSPQMAHEKSPGH